ncbi:MAG TPA: response regulator [Planctomycetota bacterium]|nr:response regulator [Planctomycetota bacterium]
MADSIMIVDDTVANLLAYAAILKKLGHRIVVAASGAEALKAAEREPFSVILMDIRMPEMNGVETASLLRKSGRATKTPIVFLSAFEMPLSHLYSQFMGGNIDFLPAPVDAETLTRKVETYFKASAAETPVDGSDPNLQKTSSENGLPDGGLEAPLQP